MKKRFIILSIIAIILILTIFITDFTGLKGKKVTVSVPQGSGAKEIATLLKDNHVIRFPFLFLQYIEKDAMHLKAGVHTFNERMGYEDALTELKRDVPLENTVSITIPEGYEAREIRDLLADKGIVSKEHFDAACRTAHETFVFLPPDGNVEGYLFPATYTFQVGSDAKQIVHTMLKTFENKLYTNENINRLNELGLSFHEALTLASIIEREAAMDSERATVSSVFHNRMRIGMRLESCATVQYVLKERKDILAIQDTKIDSPYNTYIHEGLPPAPISSPGESSFKAALYPSATNYLFFVADGTGGHAFSETYEEHLNAVNSN